MQRHRVKVNDKQKQMYSMNKTAEFVANLE